MQYVTKFINVIGSYYGEIGINSANSTGATDIIVVEQPDGTFKCTPFHVRFGKLNILRPKEVIVDLYLNNEFVKDLNMRVEPTGHAYFELQNEDPYLLIDKTKSDLVIEICDSFKNKEDLNPEYINIQERRGFQSHLNNRNCEDDATENTENQSNIDTLDPGYRSCDEITFPDSKLSQILDLVGDARLSLCGELENLMNVSPQSLDIFFGQAVSYEEFSTNPFDIINNPNLVIFYNNKFMTWKAFSFIVIARLAYNEKISESLAVDISNAKRNSNMGYSKWLRWGSSYNCNEEFQNSTNVTNNTLYVKEEHEAFHNVRLRTLSGDIFFPEKKENYEQLNTDIKSLDMKSCVISNSSSDIPSRSIDDSAVHFATNGIKKTNVIPNDKLKLFKLNEGVNELFYVITGKYRGTIKVGCKVYLWHWSDRIVVSDIDGTITKSDVWGQLAPWLGLDWTQSGIVKLYNNIQKNYFRFVYLSARAIGQADQTRDYLKNVNQQELFLPDGPLLLAPNSLFIAFKKEVIDKTPEEFKISCLNELRYIFPVDNNQSLYAGFGNKPSDEKTYKAVGISESKIFTVNKKGELHNKALVSSLSDSIKTYDMLTQLVNQYFPSKYTELPYSNEYSSFSFWRDHIPCQKKFDN